MTPSVSSPSTFGRTRGHPRRWKRPARFRELLAQQTRIPREQIGEDGRRCRRADSLGSMPRRSPIDRALAQYAALRYRTGGPIALDHAAAIARQLSRREFLKVAGITGLATLTAACTPRRSGTQPDVVIVGAGLAGLTAAYWLDRAGIEPRVFEADSRAGGRCWSARDFDGGQVAEHGGEFIDTRHVHIIALIEELGLTLDDTWEPYTARSTELVHVAGETTIGRDILQGMQPAIDRLVALATDPTGPPGIPIAMSLLDEMTADDWYAAEVGPAGTPAHRVWAQGMSAWYGLDPDQLSAANLIDSYIIERPGDDERYTVHGGNDLIPSAITAALPRASVTYGAALEAVRIRGDGKLELEFGDIGGTVVADRVVLAIPFTTLRQVDLTEAGIPTDQMDAISRLGMGTNAKVLLQFDRPFFGGFGQWSGLLQRADDPAFTTWESGATDGSADLGLLTVFSGGRVGAEYASAEPHGVAPLGVVEDTLAALGESVPEVLDAYNGRSWLDHWVKAPWAGGSYAAYLPGQWTRWAAGVGAPAGSIHFAGEHTSSYSQGFLNGAVESGGRVASEILSGIGVDIPATLAAINERATRHAPKVPWA